MLAVGFDDLHTYDSTFRVYHAPFKSAVFLNKIAIVVPIPILMKVYFLLSLVNKISSLNCVS